MSQIVPFPSMPDLPGPLHGSDDLLPVDESAEGDQHTGPPAEWGIPRSFYVIRPIEPTSPESNRSA